MRILLLAHYYEPEIGAPQRRWRGLVREFVDRGHSVAVCAPVAHYPHRRADALAVFPQPVWRWSDGHQGERILRVPYAPTSGSMPGQLVDQSVSSAASVIATLAMRRSKPDVVVSTTPGLPMPFSASAVTRLLRVPHVAEVRDAWPDLITDAGLVRKAFLGRLPTVVANGLERHVLPAAFNSALRSADAVVTTTEGFSERLRARGFDPVVTVRNTSEIDATRRVRNERQAGSDLHVLYVGTVGRSQGLEAVIRATAQVPGTRLRVVGAGAEWEALRELAAGLTQRIEFFPQTSGPMLEEHWAWAHTGLVSLADVPAYEVTVPSKLVSVMARRIHVIGVLAGEAAMILRSCGGGSVAAPGDDQGLRELLTELRDDPDSTQTDERPLAWLRNHASPQAAADAYERLLEDVRK